MNHSHYSKRKTGRMFFIATLAAAIIACSTLVGAANETGSRQSATGLITDPIKTDAGYVSGAVIGDKGKEVRIYRGIPYAAPPVGDLRWKPPQPVTPWKGTKDCTTFGPWATQYTWSGVWMGEIKEAGMSEDCLHLNVITPAKTATQKLPVMVWLHDGGLDAGSGNRPMYNNPYLAQHGVVVVTISHRIGGMGLVAHPELSAESSNHASGNYEMLDIIAALKWVKQNIAAFGGNPDCVTVFGQSGGGAKVGWLLASPLAKGLFQRAIIEGSGVPLAMKKEEAEAQGVKIATKLGVKNVAEMRAKSWQEVLKAMPPPKTHNGEINLDFNVDGWSMPDMPNNIISKGMGNSVPVMIGGGESETSSRTLDSVRALLKTNPNVYVYMFTHVPPNFKKAGLVAFHGLELFYEFGGLDLASEKAAVLELAHEANTKSDIPKDAGFDKNDEIMTENTMKMWVQFAATGNPSLEGLVKWPAFKATAGEDKYLSLGLPLEVKSGYLEKAGQEERR